jgi:hypothetical protein
MSNQDMLLLLNAQLAYLNNWIATKEGGQPSQRSLDAKTKLEQKIAALEAQ